jgi:hypothetical protein
MIKMTEKNKQAQMQLTVPLIKDTSLQEEEPPNDGNYHDSDEGKRALNNATMKLVNYAYDTPRSRMAEMTIIPRRLVTKLACEVAKEAAINPRRNPITQPISEIFRYALYQLLRSVGGFHLARAGIIAQAQIVSTEEDDESEVRNG